MYMCITGITFNAYICITGKFIILYVIKETQLVKIFTVKKKNNTLDSHLSGYVRYAVGGTYEPVDP